MKTLKTILFYSLFLGLICVKSPLTPLKSLETLNENEAIEFKIGETVEFNTLDRYYFKYNNIKEQTNITFYFFESLFDIEYELEVRDPDGNYIEGEETSYDYRTYEFTFNKIGYHYFTIKCEIPFFSFVEKFSTIESGQVIDTIDLNKEMYYNKFLLRVKNNYEPMKYKINTLQEDKYVYFYYESYFNYYYDYEKSDNPFIVCINEDEECKFDVKYFYFQKGKKYTIYIQFMTDPDDDYYPYYDYKRYYYYPYIIVPVISTTIETKSSGLFTNTAPKIYNIEIENKEKYISCFFYQQILMSYTNDKIENNNIETIKTLEFEEMPSSLMKLENNFSYLVLLVIPPVFERVGPKNTLIAVADIILDEIEDKNIISSGKSAIIFLEPDYFSSKSHLEFYNILSTYSSPSKNMRYIFSSNLENKFDFLMHNFMTIPMFIDKSSQDQEINLKVYYPRYTFFGAGDSEMFRTFYELYKSAYFNELNYDLESLLPLNIRVNSDLSPFYEFFNFYLNKFEDNINLYINKLYGETDLYECSDELNQNDLTILTTPINNCKDKKSIFNRLFTFKGTKTLSGLLTPNSYFDIYLEMNDNSKKIKISPALKGTVNSASKYIKKNEVYTVDFAVEHMVKIEVVDGIEVTIFNDEKEIKLNSRNPVEEIKGSNYKVKTNSDTMIYFYGKLFEYLKQKEIDFTEERKYATISSTKSVYYTIDSGFEGYNPLNVDIFLSRIRYDETIFIENLYGKMKNKLVQNEKIYFYYFDEDQFDSYDEEYEKPKIDIKLRGSLNNPNNDYSFTVIPSNSEKSLIINNRIKNKINYQVNFCDEPHKITMISTDYEMNEEQIIFSEDDNSYMSYIEDYGTKIIFQSEKDFVFSYSFIDEAERDFKYWNEERKEISLNLKITKVIDKNSDDNILSITFLPNIKKSNVKYIIVIAPKNGDNTKESFSNPCFIAKLVNDKKDGIKIENWIDPGLKDEITVEVDINDILDKKNNNYVVGIISQELRYYKKLNFYPAFEFTHEAKERKSSEEPKKSNSKTLVIALSVVGGIIVIAAILLIICLVKKKKGSSSFNTENNNDNKLLSDM